jgi:protein-tyrosine phosphatase
MGRSRSVSIILAYLMKYQNLNYHEAREFVQTRRGDINPNAGFVQQLQVWDQIKDNWEDREAGSAYRYWRMAHDAGIIARIFKICHT